jgi:hypothetical protein
MQGKNASQSDEATRPIRVGLALVVVVDVGDEEFEGTPGRRQRRREQRRGPKLRTGETTRAVGLFGEAFKRTARRIRERTPKCWYRAPHASGLDSFPSGAAFHANLADGAVDERLQLIECDRGSSQSTECRGDGTKCGVDGGEQAAGHTHSQSEDNSRDKQVRRNLEGKGQVGEGLPVHGSGGEAVKR